MTQPLFYTGEGWADLHMHSFYSDGLLSPAAIVRHAADAGLRAIAITDHDSVEAVDEAIEEGKKIGIEVISGIELSTSHDGRDIHILGYLFDHHSEVITHQLSLYRDERIRRAERIVEKLNRQGVSISIDKILKKAGRGVIGRPHIADVLMEAGYATNIYHVFKNFLGPEGSAYEDKYMITPAFAIDLMAKAGGVAILAHPTLNMKETHVMDMIGAGIHGIECIHPKHTPESTAWYRQLVKSYKLLETGGSDCHGRNTSVMIGQYRIPYVMVEKMKDRACQLA